MGKRPPSWPPVRHPMQVFLMAASVQAGVAGMVLTGATPSLAAVIDRPLLAVWYVVLIVGGLMGLLSAWLVRRDGMWSMLLERLALSVVGPLSILYAVIVLKFNGTAAAYTFSMGVGFGLACIARAYQVHWNIQWWEARHERPARMRDEQ